MRSRMRAVAAGLSIGVVVAVGTTFALADGGQGSPQPVDDPASAPVPDDPSGHSEPNYVGLGPDRPELVDECRQLIAGTGFDVDASDQQLACQVIVARADGKLAPGPYSNQAFREALEQAGQSYGD